MLNWNTKKTWILLIIIFVIFLGIGIYFFFFQNTFSKENVSLQINGTKEVISGKEIVWLVSFKNQSEVALENTNLIFEYPSGVFDKEGEIKKRDQKDVGGILPGEEKSESFSGFIFGTKEELKEAKASLVYHPEGLSTEFENEVSFQMMISETSVIFSMELPSKVNPDEEFPLSLDWQSGFSFPLQNAQVRLSLPEGFKRLTQEFEDEEELQNVVIWDLGSLNEGEGSKRELRGKIKGEPGEEKLFKAEFGIFDEKLYEFIPLSQTQRTVKIITSTLDISQKINGDYNYIASPGDELNYIIEFKNTGESQYENLTINIEIESNALDFQTLKPVSGGKVEGKKISFSYDNFPNLLRIGPYGEGSVGFTAEVKKYDSSFHPDKGIIIEKITFGTVEKEFQTKVSSEVSFSENIYYNLPDTLQGNFDILGPYPMAQDQESTLVIAFKLENLGNNLKEAKVETLLPSWVSFDNKVYPENTLVNFDPSSRKLVLDIGNLYSSTPSQVFAIQIKIRPATIPEVILNQVKFTGKDSWTDRVFEITLPSKSTDSIQ